MENIGVLLAMVPPVLYALTNHIDKHLLGRYFKEGGVGTLVLFSALFSFFTIPYAVFMDNSVFSVGLSSSLIMLCVGVLNVVLLTAYLMALEDDDPTTVVLYYQLVPVVALGMAYVVLGETISQIQLYAMALILFGTTVATIKFDSDKKVKFKWRTMGLMLIATTCWAGEVTIGKIVVLEESVYASIFWESISMMFLGVIIFLSVPFYRQQFLKAFKVNSGPILSVSVSNEAIYGIGNAFATHAVLYAPVALVLVMQPLQTIFVFLWGILFLYLVPKLFTEKVSRLDLIQKLLAIIISGIGTYLLLVS